MGEEKDLQSLIFKEVGTAHNQAGMDLVNVSIHREKMGNIKIV